jgi:hypothetical protein
VIGWLEFHRVDIVPPRRRFAVGHQSIHLQLATACRRSRCSKDGAVRQNRLSPDRHFRLLS